MRHRKHTFRLGRTGAHRRAMLANMACALIQHDEIKTTVSKAKELRRFADKMVTYGKKGDLHHRRLAIAKLRDPEAVRILFAEVAPRYLERPGGYTRIIRLGGRRCGDAAEMCLLQFVEQEMPSKKKSKKRKGKGSKATVEDSTNATDEANNAPAEKDHKKATGDGGETTKDGEEKPDDAAGDDEKSKKAEEVATK